MKFTLKSDSKEPKIELAAFLDASGDLMITVNGTELFWLSQGGYIGRFTIDPKTQRQLEALGFEFDSDEKIKVAG